MKMPRSTFAATAVTLGGLVIGAFAGAVLAQGADQTVMTPSGPIHIKRPDVRVLEATDKKDSTFSGREADPFVIVDVLIPPAAGVDGDPIFEGAVMFRPKVSRFGYINDEGFYIGFAREYQAPTFQSGNSSATGALQFELTRQGKAHAMSFPNPNPQTSSRALHFIDDVRFITDSGHVMRPNYTMSTLAVPPNSRDPYNVSGNAFNPDQGSRLMDFLDPTGFSGIFFANGHASSITRRLVLEGSGVERSVTYGGNRYEIVGDKLRVNGVETTILSEPAGTAIDLFVSGNDLYILTDRGALLAAINDPNLTSIEAVRMPSATGARNRVRMVFARANFPTIPGPAPIDTPCVLLEDNTAVCRPDGATLDWVGAPRGQINPRLYGDRHNTVTYNEATNEVTGLRAAGLALNVQMPRGVTGSPTRSQGLVPASVVAIQHFAVAEARRTSGSNPDAIFSEPGAAGRRHEEYIYCGRLASAPDRVGCLGGELGDSLLPTGHVHAAGELEYELLDYRYRLPSPGETVKMLCSHGGTVTKCSRVSDLIAGNIAPVLTINRQAGARPIHRSSETANAPLPRFGFNESARRFVQVTSVALTAIPRAVDLPRWTAPTTITWAPPTATTNSPAGLYLNNVTAFYNESLRRLTGLLQGIPRSGQGTTTPLVITYPAATTLTAIRDGYALTSANELRCAPQVDYLGGGHMSMGPDSSLYPCAGFVIPASNTRLDWVRTVSIHIRPQARPRADIPSLPRVEFTRVEMLVGKLQGQQGFRGFGRFWAHQSSTGAFSETGGGRSTFSNIDFPGSPMTYNPWTIVDAEGIVHYY